MTEMRRRLLWRSRLQPVGSLHYRRAAVRRWTGRWLSQRTGTIEHITSDLLHLMLSCIKPRKVYCVFSFSHSETGTSSYLSPHTTSLSPMEANQPIQTIHSQLQAVTAEPQATPPPSVIGPLFSDIQREFQRKDGHERVSYARVCFMYGVPQGPILDPLFFHHMLPLGCIF